MTQWTIDQEHHSLSAAGAFLDYWEFVPCELKPGESGIIFPTKAEAQARCDEMNEGD